VFSADDEMVTKSVYKWTYYGISLVANFIGCFNYSGDLLNNCLYTYTCVKNACIRVQGGPIVIKMMNIISESISIATTREFAIVVTTSVS